MIVTIRALTGKYPRRYLDDSDDPQRQDRQSRAGGGLVDLQNAGRESQVDRVCPHHGYKGALELAATVDHLFGYYATTQIMDD